MNSSMFTEILFVCGTRADWLYTDPSDISFPKEHVFRDEGVSKSVCSQYLRWLDIEVSPRDDFIDAWEEGTTLKLFKTEAFARHVNFPNFSDWRTDRIRLGYRENTLAEYTDRLYLAVKRSFPGANIKRINEFQGSGDPAVKLTEYSKYLRDVFRGLRDDKVRQLERTRAFQQIGKPRSQFGDYAQYMRDERVKQLDQRW